MCHENKMGAAKEQHPYIICRLDKQKWWNSGTAVEQQWNSDPSPIHQVIHPPVKATHEMESVSSSSMNFAIGAWSDFL